MKTASFTLKNGMKVFIYSYPALESICIAVGVNYGGMDDRKDIPGSAHYLEHMLFKGTKRRDVNQIKGEIRDMGVVWNAITDYENTIYYLQSYKSYFESTMDLLSDMITNSTLPEKEFELERGPVLNEELMRQDNSQYFFFDKFTPNLYKKHPAKMSIMGTRETIKQIKRKDLLEMYQKYYTPKNMILTIYGNVDLKKAKKVATKNFGNFKKEYVKKERPIANEPQLKEEIIFTKANLKQTIMGIGFKCGEFRQGNLKEFLSMLALARILSSRVWDELREKRGLAYTPYAQFSPFSTFGTFGVMAGTEPSKFEDAKKLIILEFEKLEKGMIYEKELKRAKEGLAAQYMILRENTLGMAYSTTSYALKTGDYRFVEKLPELLKTVNLDDLKKYANKYIKAKKYSLVVLKPA